MGTKKEQGIFPIPFVLASVFGDGRTLSVVARDLGAETNGIMEIWKFSLFHVYFTSTS